jgi:hypothetical protein
MQQQIYSPLVIVEAKTDGKTTEVLRHRSTETGRAFYEWLVQAMYEASFTNPDEVVFRFLRPVRE